MQIMATVIAAALAKRWQEAELGILYPAIDRLPEPVLDILAYDLKVDWYDYGYSIEEKRRTLRDAWKVHRIKGTKAAVETAISAVYPHTKVLEWWEYGGDPYHFRLDINITYDTMDSAKQRQVLARLKYYKNLRSHNDGITYFVEAKPAEVKAAAGVPGLWESIHTPLELPVPIIRPEAGIRAGAVTALWEAFGAAAALTPPEIRSPAAVRLGTVTALQEAFGAAAALSPPEIRSWAAVQPGMATALGETFRTAAELIPPAIRSRAGIRLGAITTLEERFIAGIVLQPGPPPRSEATARAALSGGWEERFTTAAIPLEKSVLAVTAATSATGAVTSTQETAQTHINLQEVNHG